MLLALCLRLGIPSIRLLRRQITGREEATWLAYYGVDPFDDARTDFGPGIVSAMLANVNRDPDKTEPFSPEDFMPEYGSRHRLKPAVEVVDGATEGDLTVAQSVAWMKAMAVRSRSA